MQLLPTFAALGAALLSGAHAYPYMMFPELLGKDAMKRSLLGVETDFLKRAGVALPAPPAVGDPAPVPFPDNFGLGNEGRPYIFDPELQYVDLVNQYPWQAPGPTDQRGPCAGLNALANHGLISRSGILTTEDVLVGIGNATGLSTDATNFLHTTTTFFDGDPFTGRFSIGGYDSRVSEGGPLEGDLLGKPSGLCALGHLKSEGDASITRGDFTQPTGENSNCASYTDYFKQLLDLAREKNPTDGRITPSVLAAHQNNRKLYSIANNPNYFSPPFAGVAFTPAAHHFAFAMMANHSVENPEGIQTPESLMSWFSYSGDPQGDLTYKYGYERIPGPWYKRHPLQPWTLADIVAAVAQQAAAYPATSEVGGNTGKVNSFAGIDPADLTGGAYTSYTELSDPAKLGCFLSENIQAEAPSYASNVFQGPVQQQALAFIASTLVPTLVSSFGTCNIVLSGTPSKPMSNYNATYPGLTVGKNDQSRALSPSP